MGSQGQGRLGLKEGAGGYASHGVEGTKGPLAASAHVMIAWAIVVLLSAGTRPHALCFFVCVLFVLFRGRGERKGWHGGEEGLEGPSGVEVWFCIFQGRVNGVLNLMVP